MSTSLPCSTSGECSGASFDRGFSRLLVAYDVSSRTEAVCSLLCERVLASPHDVSTREASDVCLQCSDGVTFHAHSFVLCAFSEFFLSMMESWKEAHERVVLLEEWDSHVMKEVLRFLYQGRAEMPEEDPLRFAHRLWQAGLFFMAEGLGESALGYLMRHTSRETCAEVLVIAAVEGDIPELAQHCTRALRSLHKIKNREEAQELLAAAELVGGALGDEVAGIVFHACTSAVVVKNCMDLMSLGLEHQENPHAKALVDRCAEVASLDTGRVLGLVEEVQREGAHRVSVEAMAVVLQLDSLALGGEDALWSAVTLWARERQKGGDDRKMEELVGPLLPFLPLDSHERIDMERPLPLEERANGHAVSSLPSRSFVEAPCLPDGLVMPGPERYIAEVAETEAEIERKYKEQVVVFNGEDVPDAASRRYPNFPQWEEGDVGAGGEVERQGVVTRQAALRELVTLIQEIQERIKNGGEEDHVWQKGVKHGMYKAMYDTENNWEQRGALFWAKYRPDPDLDLLWAHRVELSGYGGAGVPMWLLLPEGLCMPRMWDAKQGFLEFVQANWEYYQQEPVEEGKDRVAFEGEKEAWANRALPIENPLKRLPREPDLFDWGF